MGKCVYNRDWVRKYPWVKECAGLKHKAFCRACKKEIDIGKMGESALRSHAKGEAHVKNEKSLCSSMKMFFDKKPTLPMKSLCPAPISTCSITTPTSTLPVFAASDLAPGATDIIMPNQSITKFMSKTDVLKSEIIWTLDNIMKHASCKSNEGIADT